MKIRTFANAAAVLALGLATWVTPGKIQSQPLYDRVDVNLPYTVTIGDKTLQPGSYIIQQLRDTSGDSRVLLIYSDNGMKFETSAMTIPALDPNTARDTKVILHHFGNDYYFDKIWIQGKDYGYEFPLPDSVKARQREALQPVSVAATYSTAPATNAATTTAQTTTSAATNKQTTTAQSTMPPATTTSRTTTAQNQNTMPPATTQAQNTTQSQNTTQANNTMPPATTGNMTAQNTMPATTTGATNRGSANRSMPNTSAGWLLMLLSGGALSGAGLSLRRRR